MSIARMTLTLIAAALLPALAAACAAEDATTGKDNVVASIPWSAPEAYRYVIVNEDEEQQGEGVLSVTPGDDGTLELMQAFSDDEGNSDFSVVVVEDGTLRPVRGERTIIDRKEDRRVVARTLYGDLSADTFGVRIAQLTFAPAASADPSDTRCSPLSIDEDYFYDNDASLFLWRTLTFEQGYTVTYTNVIAGRRDKRAITLRVRKQETVTTAAGEFDAWAVGIEGEGRETQRAWFATTPDHKLLAYNNSEGQVFLYAGEAEQPDPEPPGDLPEKCVG